MTPDDSGSPPPVEIPFGMTPDELLAAVGPSWSSMTPAQRAAYGPPMPPRYIGMPDEDVASLIELATQFPNTVISEGLARLARRWGYSAEVVDHAIRLDQRFHYGVDADVDVDELSDDIMGLHDTPVPAPPSMPRPASPLKRFMNFKPATLGNATRHVRRTRGGPQ